MSARPEVLVIGAGVSGLTTAVCLAEAGLAVRVRTRQPPHATTSCAAGAIWGPYLATDERVIPWAEETRTVLCALAAEPDTGVRCVHGMEAARAEMRPPQWATEVDDFRACVPRELPAGFGSAWWYTVPLVDMPMYLDYLVERLADAGGTIELGEVESLAEATARAPIAVNCTGARAVELVADRQLTPTRGQLVVVENPGVDRFFVEHDESPNPTYFLPHGDHVVLGGSAEPARTDMDPDPGTSAAIRSRCAAIEPSLGRARVLGHRVGLRPSRPRVRLERVDVGRRHVIHNYGHGGSGVTLSWGCAREVLALVERLGRVNLAVEA
jgi:D-amino-acid oxidase